MRIHKITVRDIVNFLLRNIATIKLSGLYNGRAGLSLSLFVAANYLRDEKSQQIAFRLLKEALVTKTDDFSFENGLSGIGYVLLYLIENKFLEADYDEIFRTQHQDILTFYDSIEKNPSLLIQQLKNLFFLSKVTETKDDKRILSVIKKIFEGTELFLTIQFNDFDDLHYLGVKTDVLKIFKTYLKLVDYAGYADFSRSVLDDYAVLYRQGKIASSLETGLYLNRINNKYNIKVLEDIIHDNRSYGLKNIHPFTLSLREKIDLAKLAFDNMTNKIEAIDMLYEKKQMSIEQAIRNLVKTVDIYNPLGYGAGLARLLIYLTDKNIELL